MYIACGSAIYVHCVWSMISYMPNHLLSLRKQINKISGLTKDTNELFYKPENVHGQVGLFLVRFEAPRL